MNSGALSHIYHDKEDSMPAKKFLTEFPFDPSTFNFDQFKERLTAELDSDESLTAAKMSKLTEDNTALDATTRDLKIRLFDATVMKQGDPVAPTDSPAGAGATTGTAPVVPDSDIFG